MEFHIPKSSNSPCFQDSFDFSPQDLASIPCPDDICTQAESSPQEDDNEILLPPGTSIDDFPDLPLPPGISEDEFPIPLPPKQKPLNSSNNFSASLPPNEALETLNLHHCENENFNILPLDEDSQQKHKLKTDEFQEDISDKQSGFLDESKSSPTKMDSDEENQDFTTAKPKVLGKEQAKKRLMAFSLSKQPSTSVKKQNKTVTPAKNKEKPPNPNKSTNVQEQFRATISAIEEEKKKMFQNMPSYLLLEMSELAKSSHSSMSSSIQLLEKLKSENTDLKSKDNSGKDGGISNKSNEDKRKRSFHKSRSRSKEKKPRRSRSKRRSRSRTKRSLSRSRRRSYSRSHSRRSREKNYKADNKNSRETQAVLKKKSFEDWKSFKASGAVLEAGESELPKNRPDESKSRRDKHHKRSRSPNDKPDFKPIFNYLNKGCNQMTSLQAKPADPSSSSPVFLEKIIKYTRTKPILCWAENPARATEFYMSRQMLLENCDETLGSILLFIIENKKPLEGIDISEPPSTKNRPWYPRENYFLSASLKTTGDLETIDLHSLKKATHIDDFVSKDQADDKEGSDVEKEHSQGGRASFETKISLVNDSYLSDEEEHMNEMVVGEVKVQLEVNRVKVRSRWDSDYEGEHSEKELIPRNKEKRKETGNKMEVEKTSHAKEALIDDFDVAPCHEAAQEYIVKKKSTPLGNLKAPHIESPGLDTSIATAGNLVSEYEQFLRMVSVDSSEDCGGQKEKVSLESKPKTDKLKAKKLEKPSEDKTIQSAQLGATDWDQESDHEEKSISKKMQFTDTGPHDEFLILRKNESVEVALEKNKKKAAKKKVEKPKSEKKKLSKKSSKAKKKKFEDSLSEDDSTSESYDSDADSDSESTSSGRKKKKKTKTKKKSKKDSSSESDSDSEDSKTKKKKQMKKKGKKKKSSSSDENDEVQTTLLKQLDFKKQLIMKKIEEIDSISDKTNKKKERESRGKKTEKDSPEETDLEKYIKSEKKKKSDLKNEKDKKKSKYNIKKGKVMGKRKKLKKSKSSSESFSDSESSDESVKKKKTKKAGKRKRFTSESSDSGDKSAKVKSKSSNKTSRKTKKIKRDSSSTATNDSEDSSKETKKTKKENKVKNVDEKLGKMTELGFKDNLLLDEPNLKSEERSEWENKKTWKKLEEKSNKEKEEDDWEASSSVEESEQERKARESSWDEEFEAREAKPPPAEDSAANNDRRKATVVPDKECTVNNSTDTCEVNNQLSSEALKTSLSNFSFNENSFCSFGQELSRDFFLADRSYSNSGNISNSESFRSSLIEPRPFQSVSKDSLVKKPPDSELYSPGYSDSDLSEAEISKLEKPNSNVEGGVKEDVYDPLNCDSEGSDENNEIELSSIPLPHVPDVLPPGEGKNFEKAGPASSSNSEGSVLKDLRRTEPEILESKLPCRTPPVKSFITSDFTPVAASQSPLTEETNTPTKRQLMSVKGQQKLISKAASVFQDESDEENIEPRSNKEKISESTQSETSIIPKEKNLDETKGKKEEKHSRRDEKEKDYGKRRKKYSRDRSRERSNEREGRRRRSRSRESRDSSKTFSKKAFSPRRRRSRTPEINREKREIRSDSFEIEPLKGAMDSDELSDMVQPIPVLTGLEAPSSEGLWSRSLAPGCEFQHTTDTLVDHAESFDIYPSEETNFRHRNYEKDYADHEKFPVDKLKDQKSRKERRKSRSRSYSPRKKPRSKSPERRKSPRNRSPRRKSASPKRRDKSPFSPRRRSPKRKSPSRRYKISRSPDKRRKSLSRSPRKRRGSPSRRSQSISPRKYRSPKHRDESPRKKDSPGRTFGPRDRFSPRDDTRYSASYSDGLQNRIPVIGAANDDIDMELSPSAMRSPFEGPMGFPRHLPESSVAETEMYSSFYEGEYADEFGVSNYPEEVGVTNLITVKNHDIEKTNSPERLSLDQRIELELGVHVAGSQASNDQYQMANQVCPPFQDMNSSHFPNYNCENTNISSDNFYQNQNVQMNTDFNGQYFNGHQQQSAPGYGSFQQYPNSQPSQNSVLQVGNIVEVVPTLQHPLPSAAPKAPQIMQVGNVLQVVPSQKASAPVPSHNYGPPEASSMVKTQKATAVVAPSSIVPTPNPEAVLNPLIKAIQLEREKRRKEKEKRKAEREARRKVRQMRREAKLMSVNEKLKKSVQNEGLMLGQEVEDDELLDGLDVPSPPIPVEIITVSTISALPPAGKGILITAGFMPKPPSEKKEVKFADGVCPGEGTSTSGGEDIASPPPKPKLPKEKRFKKKKTKMKKKVKVQIIRQIIQEDDDDEDDLSPPPPPPGDPPLVFFAKFPFAGDAQFPVYQTQTTTTTLTTVQYPAQTFE